MVAVEVVDPFLFRRNAVASVLFVLVVISVLVVVFAHFYTHERTATAKIVLVAVCVLGAVTVAAAMPGVLGMKWVWLTGRGLHLKRYCGPGLVFSEKPGVDCVAHEGRLFCAD